MTSTPEGDAMNAETIDKINGISSKAVELRTGKAWPEWIAVLDAAGAMTMTHQQIVAVLAQDHGVGPWWQQMVTVGYEQFHGRRVKHEAAAGFHVNRTKTVHVPVTELYRAWHEKRKRSRWLADPDFTIRKATADRSLRITWVDGDSSVDVMFLPKGDDKSQVAVDHGKLASAADAERVKGYWTEQLDRLKVMLEG
jgi:hypothetical protein